MALAAWHQALVTQMRVAWPSGPPQLRMTHRLLGFYFLLLGHRKGQVDAKPAYFQDPRPRVLSAGHRTLERLMQLLFTYINCLYDCLRATHCTSLFCGSKPPSYINRKCKTNKNVTKIQL